MPQTIKYAAAALSIAAITVFLLSQTTLGENFNRWLEREFSASTLVEDTQIGSRETKQDILTEQLAPQGLIPEHKRAHQHPDSTEESPAALTEKDMQPGPGTQAAAVRQASRADSPPTRQPQAPETPLQNTRQNPESTASTAEPIVKKYR